MDGMKPTGKTNDECATLRKGNMPKAEKVRTATEVKGAARKAAMKQNCSDGKDDAPAVIPNNRIPAPPTTSGCK